MSEITETNPLDIVKESILTETEDADELVRKPLRQTLQNSGKLLRPSLLIWAAGLGGKKADRKVISAAAALELLHTSSLIHDDIIDDGEIRRGLPAVHSLFGNSVAVYTGDYTIVKCYKLLHESGNDNLIYDFIIASEKLCKSEIVQYQNRGKQIRENQYLEIAAGKTGALFSLALSTGGQLGGLTESQCSQLSEIGTTFGIAFQIADDCLDYGKPGSINKSVLTDLRQGLTNMPMICALKHDDGRLQEALRQKAGEGCPEDICRLVREFGGIADAKAEVRRLCGRCRVLLTQLPQNTASNFFTRLLETTEEQNK